MGVACGRALRYNLLRGTSKRIFAAIPNAKKNLFHATILLYWYLSVKEVFMKTTLRYLFLLVFLVGCSGDDSRDDVETECDDLIFDQFIYPEFFLRFVDASGVNLLENGSIDPENIVIEDDSGDPVSVFYTPEDENYSEALYYSLIVTMPRDSETLQGHISIDGFESVEVTFRAEQVGSPCFYYKVPIGASANGEDLEQIELPDGAGLIVILPLVAQE